MEGAVQARQKYLSRSRFDALERDSGRNKDDAKEIKESVHELKIEPAKQ